MPDGNGGGVIKALVDAGLGYAWFALLAVWGGTVNYIRRVRRNNQKFSIVELVGEWTISAFAGVITALLCSEMGMSLYATSALAGIAGHMGGRAIFLIEIMLQSKVGIIQKPQDDEQDK